MSASALLQARFAICVMHAPGLPACTAVGQVSAKPELGSANYGYGFIAGPYLGRPFVGHNGRSWGQCTEFGELRDTPYTIVVLSNLRMDSCRPVTEKILRVLRPTEVKADPAKPQD